MISVQDLIIIIDRGILTERKIRTGSDIGFANTLIVVI